jgi:hypothetical protein
MTPELAKSPSALEQLADLNKTLKKEKVELTPEFEEYVRSHVRAVQDKLQARQDVYESDLAFIDNVKMWVMMPKNWRGKYKNMEEMMKFCRSELYEANKRNASLKQWLGSLHVAEAAGEKRGWIDKLFTFKKEKTVVVNLNLRDRTGLTSLPEGLQVLSGLNLEGCTGLTSLPKGLDVSAFLNLKGCTGLTSLPEGLKVGKSLDLEGCTGLTSLPEGLKVGNNLDLCGCTRLTSFPRDMSIRGSLSLRQCMQLTSLPGKLKVGRNMDLRGCTGLTSLPEDLEVGGSLNLRGCINLTSLPKNLIVRTALFLSDNLHDQVIEDAKRLKSEGKILGEVQYK